MVAKVQGKAWSEKTRSRPIPMRYPQFPAPGGYAMGSSGWPEQGNRLCSDEHKSLFRHRQVPLVAKFVLQLVDRGRTCDDDPRPIRVVLLDVPDRPQYRSTAELSALRGEHSTPSIKVGLPVKPSTIFVSIHDPNCACRLPLKSGVEDDRDFHVGSVLDVRTGGNGRGQAWRIGSGMAGSGRELPSQLGSYFGI